MRSILTEFVKTRFGGAIALEDASQLAYSIFCTLDSMPDDLREIEWTRLRISEEFATLATQGMIKDIDPTQATPGYWNQVTDDFLAGREEPSEEFRSRLYCSK